MSAQDKISRELQNIAGRLRKDIEQVAGQPGAFSLFVWTEGRSNYISTADRETVIAVLEEHIKGWKAGMPDIPAHEVRG